MEHMFLYIAAPLPHTQHQECAFLDATVSKAKQKVTDKSKNVQHKMKPIHVRSVLLIRPTTWLLEREELNAV